MANHAHTTTIAPIARRRAARAGGVLDRREAAPFTLGGGGPPFWDEPLTFVPVRPAAPRPRRLPPRIVPGHIPQRLTPACRARIEAEVEILVSLLDALDGEETDKCDAEDSILDGTLNGAGRWDHEGRRIGSEEDAEPSLGWTADGQNSEPMLGHLAQGDFEQDTVDDEAETDMCLGDEPLFPWKEHIRQQGMIRAGSVPGDEVPVRWLGGAA